MRLSHHLSHEGNGIEREGGLRSLWPGLHDGDWTVSCEGDGIAWVTVGTIRQGAEEARLR